MKKILYIILLVVESLAALIALSLLFSWELWLLLALMVAAVAALLVVLCKLLKKHKAAENPKGIRQAKLWIALTLLLPHIPVIIGWIGVIIALVRYG